MASGIFALLDDIAAIAKASASTLDDVASNAAKASTKSAAVVIDDAAVGPTYVVGIPADREIPIVKAIAWGSIKSKMLVIIPLALLLSQFAEWALPVLLTLGGLFLAFEGTEKVAEWLGVLKHHEAHHADDESSEAHERTLIGDAVRTDLILSTEIMLISLAAIKVDNFLERAAVLTMVGFMMTAVVYGAVAIVVRLDDWGLRLAARESRILSGSGRGLVSGMPFILNTLSVVGTAAMLWVGGHLIVHNTHLIGMNFLHHIDHAIIGLLPTNEVVAWFGTTTVSLLVALTLGTVLVSVFTLFQKLRSAK